MVLARVLGDVRFFALIGLVTLASLPPSSKAQDATVRQNIYLDPPPGQFPQPSPPPGVIYQPQIGYPQFPSGYFPAQGLPGVYQPALLPPTCPPGYPAGYAGCVPPQAGGPQLPGLPQTVDMIPGRNPAPTSPSDNIIVDRSVYARGQTPNPDVQAPTGSGLGGQGDARFDMVERLGRNAGIISGYAQESSRINVTLRKQMRMIDAKYNFEQLMIGRFVVPPVVGLSHSNVDKSTGRILHLSMGRYEIYEDAKVSAQPPSWRTYLFMQSQPVEEYPPQLRTAKDEKVYYEAYKRGIKAGVQEARASFEAAERRMRRDYAGMSRFHKLYKAGAITLPKSVTNGQAFKIMDDGRVVLVGMKTIRISVNSRFTRNAKPSVDGTIDEVESIYGSQQSRKD
jgi:defect in organelle trafficking protein DotC